MKAIVISNPTATAGEATLINELFNEGLACFHLRKPNLNEMEVETLLHQIDEKYHPQIALHQHHQLLTKFDIKRLHYPEHHRQQTKTEQLQNQKEAGFTLSTSIHQIEMMNNIPPFDYTFFGPLFNSISKKDYQGTVHSGFKIKKEPSTPEIVALGGITDQNLHQIKTMNFDGFAVLGFIWENPENAISNFKVLQRTL